MKSYKSVDPALLDYISNPTDQTYENNISIPEFTFIGNPNQPDFGKIYITFYARQRVIELKSLKNYFLQYRDVHISYERLINLVYDHLMGTYDPVRLRIVMEFYPRGGISSRMAIDSDWHDRGGEGRYYPYESGREWPGIFS